ncbi:MAG: HEAT repeat domain-containing protein, partial [Bryobacteraceae bacterium]
ARHDANPGVRLRALEALHGYEQDAVVRDTLLSALTKDENPGVRIVAINELRALVDSGHGSGDPRLRKVLQSLVDRDANNYVRLQAAAAVRRLDSGSNQ